ncbi:MAG: DUF1565 domain-containing protein [Methyloprofundus sp.]|nr:DUF1565 domain-containing protein [Methyloprofundus sp.]
MTYKNSIIPALITALSSLTVMHSALAAPPSFHKSYYIHPNGNDQALGSMSAPYKTIQHALKQARAGETIVLMEGVYLQDVKSVHAGTADKPIRIVGLPGAIVKGAGNTSIFDIRHSYIELNHFTIDGLFNKKKKAAGYRKKLVYIKALKNKKITGVKLLYMTIQNARDECVRIKYQAHHNEVAFSKILDCGIEDYVYGDPTKNHNGEAIYIGTAPEQIKVGKNPTKHVDRSNENWIHHNYIEPNGSECVDVKEGSEKNLIEFNACKHEKDKNVGGISIRGNNNTIRNNHVTDNDGAGIRLGGDTADQGINNHVYNNHLANNMNSGLKIMTQPQGKICDNTIITRERQKKVRVKSGMSSNNYTKKCR